MTELNPKVDAFINRADQWQDEYKKLRSIVIDSPLIEELKWGVPCYTFQKSNVILIHGFKEYCAVLFPKGVLLKDPAGILFTQTENVQSARQIRFSNITDIKKLESSLKAYIQEAIEVERSGLKVEFKKTSEFKMPVEFKEKLAESPELKKAFEALTPGRQRAYLLYFVSPKQPKTRMARIDNLIPQILKGKGLND